MIENIIFDLGGVLLTLDKERTVASFVQLGWEDASWKSISEVGASLFENLEDGSDTPARFREKIRAKFKGNPTDQQIDEAWNAMLVGFPSVIVDYLNFLRGDFNLYLLSNTNELHLRRFRGIFYKAYGYLFDDLFTKTYYSHEIGYRKPDPKAYLKVISDAGINKAHTLFIDDLKINTEAAAKLGLRVLHVEAGTLPDCLPAYFSSGLKDNLTTYLIKRNHD